MSAETTAPRTLATFADAEAVLAQRLPGYTPRPAQQLLARTIEQLIADCRPSAEEIAYFKEQVAKGVPGAALPTKPPKQLMAQAGTGTGKSLGAMIPSILSEVQNGGRVILATSTIALMNQYCLAPETRILTADLRYIRAGDVTEGMSLLGFDEERVGHRRRYRTATVESATTIQRPCYRLKFDDGTQITASSEHRWLVRRGPNIKWMTTESLCVSAGNRPGSKVIRLMDTWDGPDTSYEAGYLAASFDGEGSLTQRKSDQVDDGVQNRLTFAQRSNPMNRQVSDFLSAKGFKVSSYDRGDIWYTGITSRRDIVRFLGEFRPARLLPKFNPDMLGTLNTGDGTRLIAKEFVGTQDVAAIKTSTGTFIAEGLASHNCDKDLPFLQEYLPVPFKWSPLKGLSNYVCLDRLNEATPDQVRNIAALIDEVGAEGSDHSGDRDKVATVVARDEWQHITMSSDECPGRSTCAFGEMCFGYKAKDIASEAHVVITNAKMAMLDIALGIKVRKSSAEEPTKDSFILGERTLQIFDEGHELAGIAAETLGFDIKEGGLRKFAEQATTFVNTHSGATAQADDLREAIEDDVARIGRILHAYIEANKGGENGDTPAIGPEFVEAHLEAFNSLVKHIDLMWNKLSDVKIEKGRGDNQSTRRKRLQKTAENFSDEIKDIMISPWADTVAWPETYKVELRNSHESVVRWTFKLRPIDVGPILAEELWSKTPAVVLSATLATGNHDFTYMARTLGLYSVDTLDVGTPFDYPNQGLLFHPGSQTPKPVGGNSEASRAERKAWQEYSVAATQRLVQESRGGAMLLYTSTTDMLAAHEQLAPVFEEMGFTTFLQGGDLSNKEIAARFKEDEDSVLFGSKSFMVGVDFPGRTCRLVVLAKFPFPVPTDPMFAARARKIGRENPGDTWASFSQLSVPEMSLTLHQSAGRLIRHINDYGVFAILDPRMGTSRYGREIRSGMPPMPYTTNLEDVAAFYRGWRIAEGREAA